MNVVIFDRALMGFSLGVHIFIVTFGMALPLAIFIAELAAAKWGDKDYAVLAKRLSTALIVLFAVGTASGTVVALELTFLWPKFIALVGQVAVLPLVAEVFAFFTEAIFLSAYIYFRDRTTGKYTPAMLMLLVTIAAALSGAFITMINAFMNTPVGFNIPAYLQSGVITGVNPLAVFNSPSSAVEVVHVLCTTYLAGAFMLLGYFIFRFIRTNDKRLKAYYKKAMKVAFPIIAITIYLIVITGTVSLLQLITQQPEKYAAIEADLVPQSHAPEYIGGFLANNTLVDYIAIPNLQSILATGSANGTVPGLSSYPRSTWPPLFIHDIFDLLVFFGFAIGIFILFVMVLMALKKDPLANRTIGWLLILCSVIVVFLLEGGWVMAEVGRQPWIVYNVMTVEQAANYSSTIVPIALLFMAFYILIVPFTFLVLKRVFDNKPLKNELVSRNGRAIR